MMVARGAQGLGFCSTGFDLPSIQKDSKRRCSGGTALYQFKFAALLCDKLKSPPRPAAANSSE